MITRKAGFLLMLLWLAACSTTGPVTTTQTTESNCEATQKETSDLTQHSETPPATTANTRIVTIDTSEFTSPVVADEMEVLTLARLLERLDRTTTLEPDSAKRLIRQLDARFEALNPADRYELALLLTRKNANSKALNRAISILDGLKEHVKDRIAQQIIELHRRRLVVEKQYLSEHSKTIELTKKIERLKGLEQDLDKSNTRIQESLNPASGEPRQP